MSDGKILCKRQLRRKIAKNTKRILQNLSNEPNHNLYNLITLRPVSATDSLTTNYSNYNKHLLVETESVVLKSVLVENERPQDVSTEEREPRRFADLDLSDTSYHNKKLSLKSKRKTQLVKSKCSNDARFSDSSDFSSDSIIEDKTTRAKKFQKKLERPRSVSKESSHGDESIKKSRREDVHTPTTPAASISTASKSQSLIRPIYEHDSPVAYLLNIGTPTTSRVSTPMQSSTAFNETVVALLADLKAVQDQNSIKINEILKILSPNPILGIASANSNITLPTTPIATKAEFKEMETFLEDRSNFQYIKSRLSAIGGPNVRISSMNMMKFLLSNKIAIKFNWSGRDKKSFKTTKMMEVVYESVKSSFSARPTADLNDLTISSAVKDWLKLAKQRYMKSQSRKCQ